MPQISKWISLSLFLILAPNFASAITLGELVPEADIPGYSTVILMNYDAGEEGSGLCTGALVAPDLVVTAAHCLVKISRGDTTGEPEFRSNAEKVFVHFGNLDQNQEMKPALTWKVADFRLAKDFCFCSSGIVRDLALVKLKAPAPEAFATISILRDRNKLNLGTTVLLAGYGVDASAENPIKTAGILRYYLTAVLQAVNDAGKMTFLKTDGGESGGDSGGPAIFLDKDPVSEVLTPRLVGTASGYNSDLFPTYTPLTEYLDWLDASALEMGSSIPQ